MATIGTAVTLMDLARRLDPNDKIAAIIELLNENNEILQDMKFVEGNLLTGYKTTVRTGLPAVTWRKLNYGVQKSKSLTQQIVDTCGMLEGYSEVDKDLVDLASNKAAFRLSEDIAFLEAMSQEMVAVLFYGDTDLDSEKYMGIAPRYDTPSTTKTNSGYNMITGGGSGADNTSIWLVVWGFNTVHGIYPKGSKAGFQQEDKGQKTLQDAAGGYYEGYRTHYQWKAGLTVRDWRYVVRICNIDISDLTKDASGSSADLVNLMVQAVELPPNRRMGTSAFYCSDTIRSFLRRQITNKDNVNLTIKTVAGEEVLAFDGIPVRKTDQILETEATIAGTFAHDDS